jgi:hypothetical protein
MMQGVEFLEPRSPAMALRWMTVLDQFLGLVCRDGQWRVRWIRVDPLADVPGLLVSAHEEDLACDMDTLVHNAEASSDPALPLPSNFVAPDEEAALRWAEDVAGARRDRWVNQAVDGWRVLCEMRGHL